MNFIKNNFLLAVFSFLLLIFVGFTLQNFLEKKTAKSKFEKSLEEKIKILDKEIEKLNDFIDKDKNDLKFSEIQIEYYDKLFKEKGIAFFVSEDKKLKFWSVNQIPYSYSENKIRLNEIQFISLRNGHYLAKKTKHEGKNFLAFILLKNNYYDNNEYLVNELHHSFFEKENIQIDFKSDKEVFDYNGNVLFYYKIEFTEANLAYQTLFASLFFLLVIILLRKLIAWIRNSTDLKIRFLKFITALLSIVIIRYLTDYFNQPSLIYDLDVFSPTNFAGNFFYSSIGDLILNIILIFYLLIEGVRIWQAFAADKTSKTLQYINDFLLIIFILGGAYFINTTINELVVNSNIPLQFNNILSLNLYSYLVLLLLISLFLTHINTIRILLDINKNIVRFSVILIVATILYVSYFHLYIKVKDLLILLWQLAIILVLWLSKKRKIRLWQLNFISIVFLALVAAHSINKYNVKKEQKNRLLLAETLSNEKDPILEYIFLDQENLIKNDKNLIEALNISESEGKIYLLTKYLNGYWSKYNLSITFCDENTSIEENQESINCHYFFESLKNEGERNLFEDNISLIESPEILPYYLFTIHLENPKINLYIEAFPKVLPKGTGYPELFLKEGKGKVINTNIYSFAKYKGGLLVEEEGSFNYPESEDLFNSFYVDNNRFVEWRDYNHLIYKYNNSTIVISLKPTKLFELTTFFSYVFGFFALSYFVFYFISFLHRNKNFPVFNLKMKIQMFLVLTTITTLLVAALSSLYFFYSQYETKNITVLDEKIKSVMIELEHKIYDLEDTNDPEVQEYLHNILIKFSNVFFSDINLYLPNGKLLVTSRADVYNKGYRNTLMNTIAFYKLNQESLNSFFQKEKIGEFEYLSAYMPFKNQYGEKIAYLNLPYFTKQNELKNELSMFIVSMVNIYMLLLIVIVLVALFISNYITMPLAFLKNKMSLVKVNEPNERIEWKKDDEIGKLINEYNKMIVKIEESTKLLAVSERESAWREMAKQVAHEIKNPLTPIKLNIQLLQRALEDNHPDFENRFRKSSKLILEQIEALSRIASEFSNFAKMPKAENEVFSPIVNLQNCINLFKEENNNIAWELELNEGEKVKVLADKNQITRVFNNLIKNAIQAIPDDKKGKIKVKSFIENEMICISIQDNGIGIEDEMRAKIFTPNFTTKSGGMGLGLAMVKNILTQSGGQINFESKQNIGTTFYVKLPVFKQ